MRTLTAVMSDISIAQMDLSGAYSRYLEARIHQSSWYQSMEQGRHHRDMHQRHWDAKFANECRREYDGKVRVAETKVEEAKAKLKELFDELNKLVPA